MRLLVIIALLYGLVPSLGEGVGAVVHLAVTGHVAHFEPGEEDLDESDEHGCGTTFHLCRCCVTHVTLSEPHLGPAVITRELRSPRRPTSDPPLDSGLRRLFRPPILVA
ncbi:MAG TPA: hypothetical protein VGF45_07550 [Polyangia bacterium]